MHVMTDPFPSSPNQPSLELRNAMSALTSSWLVQVPPIIYLNPSTKRRLYLNLGVMAFGRDLAGASLFLCIRAGAEPTVHAFTIIG
jgi:hypothetical protein